MKKLFTQLAKLNFLACRVGKLAVRLSLVVGMIIASPASAADQTNDVFVIENLQDSKPSDDGQANRQQNALRLAVRKEAARLRKLSDIQLTVQANRGNRVAQLVLAENFAKEARTNALTVAAANAALGDTLRWYSAAATRGYPGSPAIDKLLPAIPVRIIKGPKQ